MVLQSALSIVILLERNTILARICSATGWRWELREEFVREEQLEVIQRVTMTQQKGESRTSFIPGLKKASENMKRTETFELAREWGSRNAVAGCNERVC